MRFLILLAAFALNLLFCFPGWTQDEETAVSYMSKFNEQEDVLGKDYLGYMSAVTHTHNGRKMERRRKEVLADVKGALSKTSSMKAFKGDGSLRDAYREYYSILLTILNEDYAKIVNMEEIAEQSYDNMEAYVLAQEKASERLDEASKKRRAAFDDFANRNKIKLIETDSKLSKKLEKMGEVSNYYHQVFLIFFKSNKQEAYLIEAFNANDINAAEQNKSTLARFSTEGLEKLAAVKPYDNDNSVVLSCRKMLEFYKNEAESKVKPVTDYIMKRAEFEKIRQTFEAKSEKERTSADVDNYNRLVNEMNKAGVQFNKANSDLNKTRTDLTNNWNNTVGKFLDTHSPK